MNWKSKNGKKAIVKASLIGVGMFAVGTGVGVIATSGHTDNGQRVKTTKAEPQGIVTSESSHVLSSHKFTSKTKGTVNTNKSPALSHVETSSSSSSSISESLSSSSQSSSSDSNNSSSATQNSSASSQANTQVSNDMPDTAAIKTYTVKRGDSLWSISQALHVSFSSLLEKNPSADPDHIEAGYVITIR